MCSAATAAMFGYVKLPLGNCDAYPTYLAIFQEFFKLMAWLLKQHTFKVSLKSCNVYMFGLVEGVSVEILARGDGKC